jgi:hypothetical protein
MRPKQVRGLVVGGLAVLVLVFAAVPPDRARPDKVVLLAAAVFACWSVRRRLGVGSRPVARPPRGSDFDALPEEQDVRLARLDASLARAAESGEQFARVTRPMLRRLAAERLRARTGIDVTADPAGARRLMGEELWAMFSTDPGEVGPPPDPRTMRDLVQAVERL